MESKPQWYYARDGKTVGPMTHEALQAALPSLEGPDTLVFGPGSTEWRPAGEVAALRIAFISPPAIPTLTPYPQTHASDSAKARTGPLSWTFDLLMRPRQFFLRRFANTPVWVFALAALLYGMAYVSDRLDLRIVSTGEGSIALNWKDYWIALLGYGALAAAFYWAVGGWWYGVRLKFCGVELLDKMLHRKIYLIAALPISVASMVYLLFTTFSYQTPVESFESLAGSLLVLIFAIFLCSLLGCWISFVGVRTIYNANPGPAAAWFLVLPAILIIGIYGVTTSVIIMAGLNAKPDLANPFRHDGARVTFELPGNWIVEENCSPLSSNDATDDDDPNDACLLYVFTWHDAAWDMNIYSSDSTIAEEHQVTIDTINTQSPATLIGSFTEYGNLTGEGRTYSQPRSATGGGYIVRVFICALEPSRYLEIREHYRPDDEKILRPALDMIESTFSLKP